MTEKVPGDSDTPITRDQARDSANRLINSFFNKEPGARAGIPARPGYDDDLVIMQYLREQAVALEAKDAKIAKLESILKPFADAVYNDNGEMTITPVGMDPYIRAYFVLRYKKHGD